MSGKGTRRNTTTGGDLVTSLLTLRNQVKLYHWQTKSFARHTATDALTTALDASIDSFVESYMGRYGRPKVSGSIKLHNFSESAARTFVATQTAYLTKVLPKKLKSTDTDLLNLRDEILAELTKVLYLFTLQ
jgi:DNA-binding ferritin-like protein